MRRRNKYNDTCNQSFSLGIATVNSFGILILINLRNQLMYKVYHKRKPINLKVKELNLLKMSALLEVKDYFYIVYIHYFLYFTYSSRKQNAAIKLVSVMKVKKKKRMSFSANKHMLVFKQLNLN